MEEKKRLSGLAKRFLAALDKLDYSGYQLADEMDRVSNATLTHIRSGRNNPSMKIVVAFLQKFPEINARWLLTGEGTMYDKTKGDTHNGELSYQELLKQIPIYEIQDYISTSEKTLIVGDDELLVGHLRIFIEKIINDRLQSLEQKLLSRLKEEHKEQ